MLTACCVMYINMGLHEAVVEKIGFSLRITGCAKCLTFWSVLALNLLGRYPVVECVAVAFLCSYAALWLTLLGDVLTTLYNKIYESIQNTDASEDSPANLEDPAPTADEGCTEKGPEVSQMQQ